MMATPNARRNMKMAKEHSESHRICGIMNTPDTSPGEALTDLDVSPSLYPDPCVKRCLQKS